MSETNVSSDKHIHPFIVANCVQLLQVKLALPSSDENCSATFLDAGQYSKNGILRYERIFGRTFVSTGGLETTEVGPPRGHRMGHRMCQEHF